MFLFNRSESGKAHALDLTNLPLQHYSLVEVSDHSGSTEFVFLSPQDTGDLPQSSSLICGTCYAPRPLAGANREMRPVLRVPRL